MNNTSVTDREAARQAGLATYEGKPCKFGHTRRRVSKNECADCHRLREKLRYELNKPTILAKQKTRLRPNRDERVANRRRYWANPEKFRKNSRDWINARPAYNAAKAAIYKANKLQATPTWCDLERIQTIYNERPQGFHVDHIVPLQGKLVCGLHIPCNLRYMFGPDNCAKSNRLDQDLAIDLTAPGYPQRPCK